MDIPELDRWKLLLKQAKKASKEHELGKKARETFSVMEKRVEGAVRAHRTGATAFCAGAGLALCL